MIDGRGRALAWLGLVLTLLACDVDQGLKFENPSENLKHGIKGRLVFSGAWPEHVSELRVVATSNFPPDPSDPLQAFVFSDPVRLGVRAVDYGLALAPATYQIVGVIFREQNQPWEISNLLAVHKPLDPCTILPDLNQAVVVPSDTSVVTGVDIFVDLTKGSFSGTVRFIGEWPESLGFVGMVALKSPFSFANLIPCGLAILPIGTEEASYRILVPADDYVTLVVAGSDLSSITSFQDLKILGTYFTPGDSSRPGVISVQPYENETGINLNANLELFSN